MSLLENISPTGKQRQKKTPPVFELLNSHAAREFREIDKDKLSVPIADYQRDESQGRISTEIAMHFDIVAFSALLVIERANGELVVADGGTRLSAARRRADISTVPCIVFSGLTEKQEGDVFLRVNCNRRKLQTEQQHHAELFSDHDLAIRTQNLIDRLQRSRIGFDSLATMRKCVKTGYSSTETTVNILTQAANDKHVSARVMNALFRLEIILNKNNKTLKTKAIIRRMQEQFGSFDAVVNAMVKPRTQGNSTEMARALARTLKIKFPAKD